MKRYIKNSTEDWIIDFPIKSLPTVYIDTKGLIGESGAEYTREYLEDAYMRESTFTPFNEWLEENFRKVCY